MGQNQATFFKSREQIVAATEPQHLLPVLFGCRKKKSHKTETGGGGVGISTQVSKHF